MNETPEKIKEYISKNKENKFPEKHKLQKAYVTYNIEAWCEATGCQESEVRLNLSYSKTISPWLESLISRIYGLKKCLNPSGKVDASIPIEEEIFESETDRLIESKLTNNITVGIRCLNEEICFTRSDFGQNPQSWHEDCVWIAQRILNYYIVADISRFPKVYLIPILPTDIVHLTDKGILGQSIKHDDFYLIMCDGKSLDELIIDGEFDEVEIYYPGQLELPGIVSIDRHPPKYDKRICGISFKSSPKNIKEKEKEEKRLKRLCKTKNRLVIQR
jgi:hypothetical protein